MPCPICNIDNPSDSLYCQECGFALTQGPLAGGADGSGSSPLTGTLTPQVLLANRYVILRKVAEGGFSAVYQAEDTRLGHRTVAVKEMVIHAYGSNQQAIARAVDDFQREAEFLARVSHPHLPRVIDRFEETGRHFLVMDFINGKTLADILAERGPLPESDVLAWASQLCDVLHMLHTQHPPIIYRDLKPQNIMLEPDGRIKLIDFGIARFYKPGQGGDTITFASAGYTAPEQLQGRQTDARTDIYGLGVTLFELLTAFDVSSGPPILPSARELHPAVSQRTAAALMQATSVEREHRFGSMLAFKQALGLGAVAQGSAYMRAPSEPSGAAGPSARVTTGSIPQHGRRWTTIIALLALIAVGIGAGTAMLFAAQDGAVQGNAIAGEPPDASSQASDPVESIAMPQGTAELVVAEADPASTSTSMESVVPVTPTSTATTTSTPTDEAESVATTAIPPLTPTPNIDEIRAELLLALVTYNNRRNEALKTSNATIIDEITSGEQRDKELRTISMDIETGASHEISLLSWNIDQVDVINPSEAYVNVSKTEDRLFFPAGCSVPDDTDPCERPPANQNTRRGESYSVRYRLLKFDTVWKVDRSTVLP